MTIAKVLVKTYDELAIFVKIALWAYQGAVPGSLEKVKQELEQIKTKWKIASNNAFVCKTTLY